MSYRIECIPNVSTADPAILERIAAAIEATEGVTLHFVDAGKSANRTVFTYLGPVNQVLKATEALFAIALSEIDMRQHQGVHPRMGAVDVCPFVLLDDDTYADYLLERVHTFAIDISAKHDLAIYGYEHLASSPERKNLAVVRQGAYEGLAERFNRGDLPDFGPQTFTSAVALHGATAMSIRPLMVAYNVNLKGGEVQDRLHAAKTIAGKIRERDGGMPGVKAIGWYLPDFDLVQVSCNLTKPYEAGVCEVYQQVQALAKALGFEAPSSELIGCIPQSQFTTMTPEELGFGQLKPFKANRILPL
jgi:glutamate formiminotransferase/formiminotetrahydrofolate cyclodeaminase